MNSEWMNELSQKQPLNNKNGMRTRAKKNCYKETEDEIVLVK